MIPPPPRSTRTDTFFPYTTLFRSLCAVHVKERMSVTSVRKPADRPLRVLLVEVFNAPLVAPADHWACVSKLDRQPHIPGDGGVGIDEPGRGSRERCGRVFSLGEELAEQLGLVRLLGGEFG